LAQNITNNVDEETETKGPTLARVVRTLACESTEAIHEVEPFGTQTITQCDGWEFHEVERPALVSGDTARCEHINLDVCRWDGRMHLVLTGKDPKQSMKRPLEVGDVRPIVDILEIWMSRYGKPVAVYTDGGALFGGSFRAWCGYRSIEHRIRSRPRPLQSGNKMRGILVPGDRQHERGWPKTLLRQFWWQWRGHTWQRGRGLLSGVGMRQEAFSRNFWMFWIWRPGLKYCKQQHKRRVQQKLGFT
jgi:hypothetical protein